MLTENNTNVNEENSNKDNNNEQNNTENENNQNAENNNQQNTDTNDNKETITVLISGEKIYITPLINSLVISTLEEEKQVQTISEVNGWSYIQVDTTSGWVRTDNIQKKEVEKSTSKPENNNENNNNNTSSQNIGYISATSVNFRKAPNTSGDIISKLPKNAKVTFLMFLREKVKLNCLYIKHVINDYLFLVLL